LFEELRQRLILSGAEELSDEQVIDRILNSIPPMYTSVIEALEDRLGAQLNPLTMEDLNEKLMLKWERSGKQQRNDRYQQEQETVLFMGGSSNA
jgi:hypothetical protein